MYFKLFFVLLIVSSYSHGQRDRIFFRNDYHYIKSTRAFYKIHTLHKVWAEAKKTCVLEGTTLFYPENTEEANAVLSFWKETQPQFHWVYIGVTDFVSKGIFESIDGIPISDIYHNWAPGEPNNGNDDEDCVDLRQDSTLNDNNCMNRGPFICKKSLESLEWNRQCNMPSLDYAFDENLKKCYKFHLKPLDWSAAYAVCSAEQSYLAVINSQLEADHLIKLIEKASKDRVTGDLTRGMVHLGFHNKHDEGWQPVRGASTLEDVGYVVWGKNQPDGGDHERCGAMSYNGELNDIACNQKSFFICEHDVTSLASFDLDASYEDRT